MKKLLNWLTRQQDASELRKKARLLKSDVAGGLFQHGVLKDKIGDLEVTVKDRDLVIEKLNEKLEIVREDLEIERSKGRIHQVEISELAALCANRLQKIESGSVDYRERDIDD